MLEKIVNRLVSVKSIVTITLTIIFSVLCFTGKLDQNFMTIYTVVVAFYFGTQAKKEDEEPKKEAGNEVNISWPEDVKPTEAAKILEAARDGGGTQ